MDMKRIFCLNKDFNEQLNVQCKYVEKQVSRHITKVEISYINDGETAQLIPTIELRTRGEVSFYMIPCVLYNGNEFGSEQAPKGMRYQGEPWIFPADRTGIPACTIAETKEKCFALFAGNDDISKNCSCSLYVENGEIVQRIYFAHLEMPKAYTNKYIFSEPIVDIPVLMSGEKKCFTCYLYEYEKVPDENCYGYKKLFDYINKEYCELTQERIPVEKVKDWNWEFIHSLIEQVDCGILSNMGFLPNGEHRIGDKNCRFMWRKSGKYQAGWCGQNLLIAELYLRSFLEKGIQTDEEIGKAILDAWLLRQHDNGLISTLYDVPFNDEELDTCNEGWIISELVMCSSLLKEAGEEVSTYENAAKKVCGYFLKNYPHGEFPQILRGDGNALVEKGGAGAFIMLGFVQAYEYFKKAEYLELAEKSFNFYYNAYLKQSLAAGGALDTYCIDKESAGPILRAAISLYRETGKRYYLDCAENAAHYLMTWCFYHNIEFDKNSDCGKLNLYTIGGTAVSVSHHHLDCWGAYYVPDMIELCRLTGNTAYEKHAEILWRFITQYISDGTLKLHNMVRSRGMQNEAVFHCNWGFSEFQEDKAVKGSLNDWMVAWVKAFQQKAIYFMGNR